MKISVVTVCYNAADTIERTMLSVLNQTYHDIEYIIIDGGSTDGTVDIIRKYADKIAYWVSEPDKGIYDAMNKGIKVATGEWINFMNAGDYYYSNEVLKNVFAISRYGDYLVGIAVYPNGRYWRPVRKDFSFKEIYRGGGVNHQASFIQRKLFGGGYDTSNKIIADELFFLEQIVFQGKVYEPLSDIICYYDNGGVSSRKETRGEIQRERRAFMEKYLSVRILADYDEPNLYEILIDIWRWVLKRILLIKNKVKYFY